MLLYMEHTVVVAIFLSMIFVDGRLFHDVRFVAVFSNQVQSYKHIVHRC